MQREAAEQLAKEAEGLKNELLPKLDSIEDALAQRRNRYARSFVVEEVDRLTKEIIMKGQKTPKQEIGGYIHRPYVYAYKDNERIRFGVDSVKERNSMIWVEGWLRDETSRALPLDEFEGAVQKLTVSIIHGEKDPWSTSSKEPLYDILTPLETFYSQGVIIKASV